MGLQIKEVVNAKEIALDELSGKVIAIDAYNMLYQFYSIIRQPDGTPLKDSKGNVTSHLSGLFNRTANLLQKKIKPVFVFDGEPHELKKKELERRAEIKKQAQKNYEKAREEKDIEAMKKYATRTSKLTKEMVEEAKKLVELMGLPVVQAPSEGEAQAAYMVKKGDAYAVASQDFDSLLFGSPLLLRNISISGKRKRANSPAYHAIKPEQISLSELLNGLGIDHDKLIVFGMLIGTDFNVGGIKGIGPSKALKMVKQFDDYEELFNEAKWEEFFPFGWYEVYKGLKSIPITDEYQLNWEAPDNKGILKLLCEEHEFAEDRIKSQLEKLEKSIGSRRQKGLGDFF